MSRTPDDLDPRPLALLAGAWCALAATHLLVPRDPPPPAWTRGAEDATPSVRELRALPGIGPRRAQALAELRWERGPEVDLEEVAGIGPRTAAAVRAALAREP